MRGVSTSETINRLKQTHGLSRRDTLSHSPILSQLSPGQKTWGAILGQTVNRFSRKFEYFVRKVAREHPGLTGCPGSDPPQLPKSQNNYLARPDCRGQSKQGQWAINQPGLFSQLFGRNSEWKENEVTAVDLVFAHWLSPAVTLSWEKITEAGWIPDNLVEIKSCLIQFLSKYWTHFEFSQLSLPV